MVARLASVAQSSAATELTFDDRDAGPKIDAVAHPDMVWRLLAATAWIAHGPASAPSVIYEFYDPQCSYCQRFWGESEPWVDSGKLQVRYIPVGLLGRDSLTRAAALLSASDPPEALRRYVRAWPHGELPLPPQIPARYLTEVEGNLRLMRDLGLDIVPGIVIRNTDGRLQVWPGLPAPADLHAALGPP